MAAEIKAFFKIVISAVIGIGFFVFPIQYSGKTTVFFDVIVTWITKGYPGFVGWYSFVLILFGACATLASRKKWGNGKGFAFLEAYQSSSIFFVLRLVGVLFAVCMFFQIGPEFLIAPKISKLMWSILTLSVGVIIPLGAIFLNIFVSYGCLEFVGVLMRPIMRPLFKLPGRSALDDITSWLGSYSVGLYITRKLFHQGYYTRRETYTIVTCFSTVSIGFVGVVASTLDLLYLFPLIFITYFFVIYFLTIVLVRMWPITSVPNTYLNQSIPERQFQGSFGGYFRLAGNQALERAHSAPGFLKVIIEGCGDGLKLATTILGTILVVGSFALMLAKYTPVFNWLGAPFAPLLNLLGLPDAKLIAPATVAGIAEMYIPALLVKDAALSARFFIAVLSISQLIFFSSVGPMMLDMFQEVPVKFYELISLFFIRTLILIPIVAGLTHLYCYFGWL
ncbi:MAG: YjiH family protein [Desulfobacteraceae bacterium]|nr:YjiH family protein [Desulfobacteraceae bacterium]